MVFAFHFALFPYFSGDTGKAVSFLFGKGGTAGVAFFFILSGFVLTWSARETDTAPRFWRRRLVKIYPNHLVTFGMAALLIMGTPGGVITAGKALANLFLLQPWFFGRTDYAVSMNPLSWSIACEALFYLLFPFLLTGLRKIPVQRLWLATGVLMVITTSVPFISHFFITSAETAPPLPGQPDGLAPAQLWFVYFFPPVRALDFILGMLAARLVITGRWPRIGMAPSMLLFAAGYVIALFTPFYLLTVSGVIGFFIVPVIAAAARRDWEGAGTVFSGRRWVWLGDTSYAFYMVHGLLLAFGYGMAVQATGKEDLPLGVALVMIPITFAFILLVARGLYRGVERPLVNRFSNPRKPTPSGGSPAIVPPQVSAAEA